jgi:hypothetical protein
MVGLALLLAIGLASLLQGRRPAIAAGIVLIAAAVLMVDLWTKNGLYCCPTHSDQPPPVYQTLRQAPGGFVAEYPITPADEGNFNDVFWQEAHDKPIINGYAAGSAEERRALGLMRLSDPQTAQGLDALGVRYVVVRAENPGYGLPLPGTPPRSYRLLARDGSRSVYRVPALPDPVLATPFQGFGGQEFAAGKPFTWLLARRGRYELLGACQPCQVAVSVTVNSFARARIISVTDATGHVLVRRRVDRPTLLSFPLRFNRRTSLWFAANPGPQSIQRTIGGTDTRSVSAAVGQLHIQPAPSPDSGHVGPGRSS